MKFKRLVVYMSMGRAMPSHALRYMHSAPLGTLPQDIAGCVCHFNVKVLLWCVIMGKSCYFVFL